eukprot:TRINITY_DN2334_c0_g1_i2.p1 TRINITY_DN2334_c0_g1~~TRINITY_DN2334_c0_g1_i2.p1  ORF type:complete len:255 (+),score=54.51 TRINITY_DN2334_c0_g1_i2:218-982(+)
MNVQDYVERADQWEVLDDAFQASRSPSWDLAQPEFALRRVQNSAAAHLYYETHARFPVLMLGVCCYLQMRFNGIWLRAVRAAPNGSVLLAGAMAIAICSLDTSFNQIPIVEYSGHWVGMFYEGAARTLVIMAVCTALMAICSVAPDDEPPPASLPRILTLVFGNRVIVSLAKTAYAVYLLHFVGLGVLFKVPPIMDPSAEYTAAIGLIKAGQLYLVGWVVALPVSWLESKTVPWVKAATSAMMGPPPPPRAHSD